MIFMSAIGRRPGRGLKCRGIRSEKNLIGLEKVGWIEQRITLKT
jgi:hypothetical protein